MKHSYKKMYNKNYLVLDEFDTPLISEDYRIEMLKRNTIEGLLTMQLSVEDNMPSFYYDITSKQSFYSYFYDNKLNKKHIISFFKTLHNTLLNLNKYLLDYDHLVIIPQCIFFNRNLVSDSYPDNYSDAFSFSFCYCPSHTADFFLALKEFIAYLLTITDHDDEKTVLISYALWQQTQNENFNLKSLMAVIDKHSEIVENQSKSPSPPVTFVENIQEEKQNNILKEPDILLKENYTYSTTFMIKNILVFSSAAIIFITNIIMKILSVYSVELFFIITIIIIIFCIFYTSGMIHEAPLHRVFDKPEIEPEPKDIIMINTATNIKNDVGTAIDKIPENDSCETVLLCVNPRLQKRRLIYSGSDFSQEAELENFPYTIGKNDANSLIINNPAISRNHARIFFDNCAYFIEDLNSSNGTKINDNSIPAYTLTEIAVGDTITFADLTYIFQ